MEKYDEDPVVHVHITPRLLGRKEVAAYCGISPDTFENYVPVPGIRLGKRKLWDRRCIDRWLNDLGGLAPDREPEVDPYEEWKRGEARRGR